MKNLILVSAFWCGNCKVVKPILKTLEGLGEITLREVDVESPEEGKEIRKKYTIQNLPTVISVDAEGNELDRVVGRADQKAYLDMK